MMNVNTNLDKKKNQYGLEYLGSFTGKMTFKWDLEMEIKFSSVPYHSFILRVVIAHSRYIKKFRKWRTKELPAFEALLEMYFVLT